MRKALQYAKDLEGVGLTRDQAEVHLKILDELIEDDMAKKSDLIDLRSEMNARFNEVASEFKQLRQEVTSEFKQIRQEMIHLEYKLTLKLGAITVTAFTVINGLFISFLKFV